MKTLQKLRLINWHYFCNITTDVKNLTFLTGPNGTGKSTIIDALQVIILGTTRPDNFNKAANEKGRSGRNLISYLRGQTGVKDDNSTIVLRKGVFTSYIAIEIYDDVNDKTFTLGACFDVDSTDKIDKHYFFLDSPFP
ncbi:MAG: AAA family ATPase, partial [Bacilli bacterium]|nr:AAA family ATPase [Bacilli bacterium]